MKRTRRADGVRILKHSDLAYLRETLLQEQNGKCPICHRMIERPCLDHSHVKRLKGTGLIRGVLCSLCNVFIAKSENNAVRYGIPLDKLSFVLRNAASYLEQPHKPFLHPSDRPKRLRLTKRSYTALKRVMEMSDSRKLPPYPKHGHLTKKLKQLYSKFGFRPEFYRSPKESLK